MCINQVNVNVSIVKRSWKLTTYFLYNSNQQANNALKNSQNQNCLGWLLKYQSLISSFVWNHSKNAKKSIDRLMVKQDCFCLLVLVNKTSMRCLSYKANCFKNIFSFLLFIMWKAEKRKNTTSVMTSSTWFVVKRKNMYTVVSTVYVAEP